MQAADEQFTAFLRKLSKAGCYPALVFVNEKGPAHYSDIMKAARAAKVVESTSQINAIIHALINFGLLEQQVITTKRPIRTLYSVTRKGKAVIQLLKQLEREVS